ncbi:nitronate monooxygenase [Luteolibacter sp. SL250]|uniref:NAD(P)H-dependent flavin oxidoreductase n=1 Tax=Luteolibacter sp. SL250 TaxID=2995170 RepID=UPI00227204EF|nr:nitronate monooxygenase [Luteolibacter sp. SL250]WAC21360.1 nitronate monooxygenase [Luteolibacter sp. SL250]
MRWGGAIIRGMGRDDFLRRLGIRHPIIQAPMAGVSTPRLAAAVSQAGGLGSISIGAATVDQAERMIAETRALTALPFNVNVFCHAPAVRDVGRESGWLAHLAPLFRQVDAEPPTALEEIYRSFLADEDMLGLLLAARPAVVSFHFGLPDADWIGAMREADIVTIATATNLHEAEMIGAAGVDAIVAQGIEAGGHRGMFDPDADDERLDTASLVRLLMENSGLPVIAAGGIMDGRGIRAALDEGAAAAQLGTAFIACPESSASAAYRRRLLGAGTGETLLTSVISGRPARGFPNGLTRHADIPASPPVPAYPVAYDAAKQLHATALVSGSDSFAVQWAGTGAAHARGLPAAELMAALVRELEG